MRTAVMTLEGSRYGERLLKAVAAAGALDLIVVIEDTWTRRWRLLRRVARRIGWWDTWFYALEELRARAASARAATNERVDYSTLGVAVGRVSSVTSPRTARLLAEHEIDLVVLGQSGIVPPDVLKVPRVGTLNAHPGVLPAYRGVDCAEWAVLRGEFDMVGSTVHWVDDGVDTGPIVRRVPYVWEGDETLETLTDRLYADCIRLLVGVVGAVRRGEYPSEPNVGGQQYYKMPRALRRQAAASLEEFLSSRRFKLNPARP